MEVWLIAGGVLAGMVLLALLYYAMLRSMFAERLRTEEVHTLVTGDLWRLRLCRYRKGRTDNEPILLLHGAHANHHVFTNPHGASLVDYLVEHGYDCWALDMRGTASSFPPFERTRNSIEIADFLAYDLPAAVAYVRRNSGYDQVHCVGHSLGGILLYLYPLVYPGEHLACVTTIGAPPGFHGVRFRPGRIMTLLARVAPSLCGAAVRGYWPLGMTIRRSSKYFPTNMRNLPPNMTAGHFFNMIEDPLPRVSRELARLVRRRKHKEWQINRVKLALPQAFERFDRPLFALMGARDPMVNVANAEDVILTMASPERQMLVLGREHGSAVDYKHCDPLFGKEAPRDVFGPLVDWIQQHPIRDRISPEELGMTGEQTYQRPLDEDERAARLTGLAYDQPAPDAAGRPAPAPSPTHGVALTTPEMETMPPHAADVGEQPPLTEGAQTAGPLEPGPDEEAVEARADDADARTRAEEAAESPARKKPAAKKKAPAKKKTAAKKKAATRKKPPAKKKPASGSDES